MRPVSSAVEKSGVRDGLYLAGIIMFSAVPYLMALGFYSDDYAFFATMAQAEPQSMWAIVQDLLSSPDFAPRPVQAVYMAALYKAFGLSPFPGHLINQLVFVAGILLFYASIRTLGVPRFYCVALPLIFANLPHYSTVRFWFGAYHVVLSMSLFFLTTYCSTKFATDAISMRWPWLLVASIAMFISLIAYEIFMPLFILIPCIVWPPWILSFDPKSRFCLRQDARLRPFFAHLALFCIIILAVFLIKTEVQGEHSVWQSDFKEWIGAMSWFVPLATLRS